MGAAAAGVIAELVLFEALVSAYTAYWALMQADPIELSRDMKLSSRRCLSRPESCCLKMLVNTMSDHMQLCDLVILLLVRKYETRTHGDGTC